MAKENKPTVADIIDDLLNGLNDLKNHDINGDGKVTIDDVVALVDQCLHGDEEAGDDSVFNVNGVFFEMIPVKAGSFDMGTPPTQTGSSTHERPVHKVNLSKDFMLGKTPVTQELWLAVMGNNPSYFKGDLQRPVEYVSWDDCQEFIAKLNGLTGKKFRLPTEAEWEYAAKGGDKSNGTAFAGSNTPKSVAWYSSNSNGTTQPVGGKEPNELGLYDMSGNVCEWVNDIYAAYNAAEQTDPTGAQSGNFKVYRNGSYVDAASNCRCGYRYPAEPTYKKTFIGLRLAL